MSKFSSKLAGMIGRTVDRLRGVARRVPLIDQAGKKLFDLLGSEGKVVKIRRGAAAGLKWRRSHEYSHRIWLGIYEPLVQRVLAAELRPGDVFWDVGCGPGIFSAIAWRLVGADGTVVSIDPIAHNIETTRSQLELNGMATTCLVEAALTEVEGTEDLLIPSRLGRSFLSSVKWDPSDQDYRAATDRITVQMLRGDTLARKYARPTLIKIDVEGSEDRVLEGCVEIFTGPSPPRLLIEAHSRALARRCSTILTAAGYRLRPADGIEGSEKEVQHLFADHPGNPAVEMRGGA